MFEKIFGKKSKRNPELSQEYMDAYHQWNAIMEDLKNLIRKKDLKGIKEKIDVYRNADEYFKKIIDKHNGPEPDIWIMGLLYQSIKQLQNEQGYGEANPDFIEEESEEE
jgi:hypothetical protein